MVDVFQDEDNDCFDALDAGGARTRSTVCGFAMMLWQIDTISRLCTANMASGIEGLGVLDSALRP